MDSLENGLPPVECSLCKQTKPRSSFYTDGFGLWPECVNCLATMTPDLPDDCPLSPDEKSLVRRTQMASEWPCFGCPREKGCPAKIGEREFRIAEIMMEAPAARPFKRKCARCKVVLTKWTFERGLRVWMCTQDWCGWTLTEGFNFSA